MGLIRSSIDQLQPGDITILGVPFDDHSSFLQGPAKAPRLIIEALESDSANYFTESLKDLNEHPRIKWIGNVDFDDYLQIENPVEAILAKGAIPLSLGGDHSITYPIVKAFRKFYPQLSILHFDSHGDLYDELDGNRYSHGSPFARIMESGLSDNLLQIGIRTLTKHQKEQAERFGVRQIGMYRWEEQEIELDGPVYLTFDLDVLDPAFAPGVSHHEPGGFSTREILHIIQQLDINIIGMDLVEYNPDRDINGVTAMTAAKILKELLSKLI